MHLDYLDSVRGLLALYVTACHAYLTYAVLLEGRIRGPVGEFLFRGMGWLGHGRPAVGGFIVLSGYCLMLPVTRSVDGRLRGGTLGFLRRRAWRILPPYYGALLISLVLIAAVQGFGQGVAGASQRAFWNRGLPAFTPGVLISHLLLIHNYHPLWQHAIDYPMWSLATEWQMYLLFPVFVMVWRRKSVGDVVMLAMRITLLLQVILMVALPTVNPWPPQFVLLFALGMAAATLYDPRRVPAGPRRIRWGWLASTSFALFVLVELTVGSRLRKSGHQQLEDLLFGGGVACLVIVFGQASIAGRPFLPLRLLESRPLVALGRFSYSLYLIHAPILGLFFLGLECLRLPNTVVQLAMLGLGIPLSVMGSYAFFLVFERPFLGHQRSPSLQGSGPSNFGAEALPGPGTIHFDPDGTPGATAGTIPGPPLRRPSRGLTWRSWRIVDVLRDRAWLNTPRARFTSKGLRSERLTCDPD